MKLIFVRYRVTGSQPTAKSEVAASPISIREDEACSGTASEQQDMTDDPDHIVVQGEIEASQVPQLAASKRESCISGEE